MNVSIFIHICNILTLFACACIALRILFFKRRDYRYKLHFGAVAWIISNSCIIVIIKFLFYGGYNNALLAIFCTAILIRVDWLLYKYNGNVAYLLVRIKA